MISKETFEFLMKKKDQWIKLDGGISNKVYKFNNKYIIKLIEKQNDNLFVSLENYYKLLENFSTTLYIDKINNIIIEKLIEGYIVMNNMLFSDEFCLRIFNLIDNQILTKKFKLDHENNSCKNVIKFYIGQLTNYIQHNNIFVDDFEKINNLVLAKISEYLEQDNFELYFSHNDIQKYNIMIQPNNQIKLIDWEYAGYTWKYFDHINFILLLINEKITCINFSQHKNISQYCNLNRYKQIFFSIYADVSQEYFNSMFLLSAYTWYLWSIVKYDLSHDLMYLEYSKKMELIIGLV